MTGDEPTEVKAAADGRVLVKSPAGESTIDLWALNDLLHDERTRQEGRRVLLDATVPLPPAGRPELRARP
jgi:hypothetical protein